VFPLIIIGLFIIGIFLFMDVTPLPHFIDLQGCGGGCCFFKSKRRILDVACMYATELGSLKITFDFIIHYHLCSGPLLLTDHRQELIKGKSDPAYAGQPGTCFSRGQWVEVA
jgi:hypothetical protein